MAITVAVIGAGSIGFTRRLMGDIVSVPELQDTKFMFHDVSESNLAMIAQLAERDLKANSLPATVTRSLDRKRALEGADYVFNVSRIGGLQAFGTDIDIPLKYGVDQCVGDTLCAGGIMYGQRGIPPMLDFCADIEAVANSDVLFMNYANPMAMLTWVANKYTNVNTLGLCHGVQGGHGLLVRIIQDHINEGVAEDHPDYRRLTKNDVNIVAAGINHQTVGGTGRPGRVPDATGALTRRTRFEDVGSTAGTTNHRLGFEDVDVAGADIETNGTGNPVFSGFIQQQMRETYTVEDLVG